MITKSKRRKEEAERLEKLALDESKLTKEERAMLIIVVADFDDIEEVANDLMKLIELSEIYDGIPPLPSTYRAEEYARSRVKQYVLARIPPGVEL